MPSEPAIRSPRRDPAAWAASSSTGTPRSSRSGLGAGLPSWFWYLRNFRLSGNPIFPIAVPLLGLSLFLGFYPKPVLDRLEASVVALVKQIDTHSDHQPPDVNKPCTTDVDLTVCRASEASK